MLIILDRDGVINHESEEYIKSPDEWIPIEGSLEAIARLKKAGHIVVIATNQSGVGRGYYSIATLEKIHAKMQQWLADLGGHIDKIYFCPHAPRDGCNCRKPRPGMLFAIAKDFPDEYKNAIFIGDSLRDVQAAQAVNIEPMLVRTGYGDSAAGVALYDDLAAAVDHLLKSQH